MQRCVSLRGWAFNLVERPACKVRGMHEYERQDTTKTLAEGIAEYYEQNPHLSKIRGMSPQAQDFFRCHDTAHVVFGCNTSLPDEAVVKLSSIFGTTAGLSVLRGYALHESTKIYRELAVKDIVGTFLRAAVIVPRTVMRCFRQRKRWPWREFSEYRNTPLGRLRSEFGIRVAASENGDSAA